MRGSLLLLLVLALAARPCSATSRKLMFTEYLPVRGSDRCLPLSRRLTPHPG
jgi:hypothetical protein